MNDTPHLTWIVERRSEIQSFLLKLYMFAEKPPPSAVDLRSGLFQLLVGTAFSLWRAVFLVYTNRQESKVGEHAQKFLEVLIRDNAINYPQDRQTQSWTVGYYLNNAYFRLHLAYQKLEANGQERADLNRDTKRAVDAFIQEQLADTPASSRTDTEGQWDAAFQAALDIFQALEHLPHSR
jgi:hypothetical protein